MWNDCSTGKKVIRIKIFHDSDPLLLKMLHAIVKCEINLKPSSYALKRGLVSEKIQGYEEPNISLVPFRRSITELSSNTI